MKALIYDYKTLSSNFQSDSMIEFKYMEPEEEEIYTNTNKNIDYLIFIMHGVIALDYDECKGLHFGAGEMFLIPQATEMRCKVLKKSSIIVLCFNTFSDICDKNLFQSLRSMYSPKEYHCTSLHINSVLANYLSLLKHYLCTGITYSNLHALKQQELFMLLSIYYTKSELSDLFYRAVGQSLNFRSMVLKNYKETDFSTTLAKICGYSYKVFIRKFRDEFSDTPYQWMQKQKARQINNILTTNTSVPIKDIVVEFKFSSHTHLNQFCEKYIGNTAAEIRKNAQLTK